MAETKFLNDLAVHNTTLVVIFRDLRYRNLQLTILLFNSKLSIRKIVNPNGSFRRFTMDNFITLLILNCQSGKLSIVRGRCYATSIMILTLLLQRVCPQGGGENFASYIMHNNGLYKAPLHPLQFKIKTVLQNGCSGHSNFLCACTKKILCALLHSLIIQTLFFVPLWFIYGSRSLFENLVQGFGPGVDL
jgi:hypothetical protein